MWRLLTMTISSSMVLTSLLQDTAKYCSLVASKLHHKKFTKLNWIQLKLKCISWRSSLHISCSWLYCHHFYAVANFFNRIRQVQTGKLSFSGLAKNRLDQNYEQESDTPLRYTKLHIAPIRIAGQSQNHKCQLPSISCNRQPSLYFFYFFFI